MTGDDLHDSQFQLQPSSSPALPSALSVVKPSLVQAVMVHGSPSLVEAYPMVVAISVPNRISAFRSEL